MENHNNKNNKVAIILSIFFLINLLTCFFVSNYYNSFAQTNKNTPSSGLSLENDQISSDNYQEKKYIKWVECNLTLEVLEKTSKLDINSHINNEEIKYNWIELISYLACKYGNNFKQFKQKDLDELIQKLNNGESIENISTNLKYYNFYFESYTAILGEFIGTYSIEGINENDEKIFIKKYGIKNFLPIAKNFSFSHYDDFGNSRSYGYKRVHLGNDLMGSIGTPIIAVESGTIESMRLEPVWWLAYRNKEF